MKKIISDFFFYNRTQKIGVVVFTLLTLVNLVVIIFYPVPEIKPSDFTAVIWEMDSLAAIDSTNHGTKLSERHADKVILNERFGFDPNTVGYDELCRLGFQPSVAKRIVTYREHGGVFKKASDLKKVYGVSSGKYDEIASLIIIKDHATEVRSDQKAYQPQDRSFKVIVELNEADSIQLCKLKGIGSTFAARIIKYRNKLGGFLFKEQLREVYGMDSVRYAEILNDITADPAKVQRIQVNLVSEAELAKHPYCGYKLSKKIIAYRTQHGNFSSLEELNMIRSVSPAELEKIKTYLTVE